MKAEREQIDTFASQYAQLIAARDRTLGQYEEALWRTGQRSMPASTRSERHADALPRLVPLRDIRERLLPLAGLPDAPLGWADAAARDAEG